MTPFFFGTSERRLFGIYAPGGAGAAGCRAAVLCHPWGQEYLRAHRSMRQLANLLTRVGVHVLRFDYFGTGDSAGEFTAGNLKGWQGDIETAIDELKDTTGAERVGLVGLRIGATLAAEVATRRRADVDRVVLWEPVVRGEEYVRELWQASSEGGSPGGDREVLGFVLTEEMSRELRDIDLCSALPSLPERTLVVVSEPSPHHSSLLAAGPDGSSRLERVAGLPCWLEDQSTGVGAIPVKVLQRIVEWWG